MKRTIFLQDENAIWLKGNLHSHSTMSDGKLTPEEMKEYQNSLDKMSDYYNTIESAEDRGRKQERIRIAEKMLETGMPIDQIAQITDLTIAEIEALR